MTMNQYLSNLNYIFGIMGYTHDEIDIIIKKLIKAGTIDSSKEDIIYE